MKENFCDKKIDEKEKKVASKPIPDNRYRQFKYSLEEISGINKSRNLTLLALGVSTGYRLQDIADLTIGGVQEALDNGFFLIQEKKQYNAYLTYIKKHPNSTRKPPKSRKAHISDNLDLILKEYIRGKPKREYIFKSNSDNGYITAKSFSRILTKAAVLINLKNISGHSLRKTYAKRIYDSYGDIERVRQRLGHKSIETTKLYLGLYDEEDKEDANVVGSLL